MDLKPDENTVVVAITSFVLVFGGLTVHRLTRFEFSESVQSLIVQAGFVVIVGGLLYHFYTDGQIVDGWLLGFSPTLGFTLNLFFTGPGDGIHVLFFYALVAAIVVASVITLLTFAIVELVSAVQGRSNETLN